MGRTSWGLVWLLWVLLWTRGAAAQPAERFEALAGAGLGYGYTTAIDLAREAGASGYGSGDDTTGRGTLGFELRAGVLFPLSLELDATAGIAIGGLALAGVERRYFGSIGSFGTNLAAGLETSARFAPRVAPDLRLLVGPAVGWKRLASSSDVGMARIDLLGVGLDAGARLRLHTSSRVVDGHLELVLRARRELPLDVYVARSADDVLFSGNGSGEAIYSLGLGISYVMAFHGRAPQPQ